MFTFTPIDISTLLLRIPAAFFAIALHEMVKARCSTWMGDPTPERSGAMSGRPFRYLEPIGFIVAIIFGFGWGRPTPTSPLYYKDRKKGILITYLTPSVVNLFLGFLAAFFVGILNMAQVQAVLGAQPIITVMAYWLFRFIFVFANVSIAIALFNMIPVPPLDAAKLLQAALSPNAALKMTQNEKLLQLVLMLLIVMGIITDIIAPITNQLVSIAWNW